MRLAAALLLLALANPEATASSEFEWIVTLDNGDLLHCKLLAVEGNRVVVRWEVSPEEPLRLEIGAVATMTREGEDGKDVEPPGNRDTLRLLDDSVLYGRATSIGPAGVEFDVPQVGVLKIPAAHIIDLTRGGQRAQVPEAKEGEFAVALKSGVALAGKLVSDQSGRLILEGEGITAAIEYESLAALVFPRPAMRGEDDDTPVAGVELRLRSGSVMSGRAPSLVNESLKFQTAGVEAAVPVADIAALAFREYGSPLGRRSLRTLLAWGRWSDPGEEFRRTVDAVKEDTAGRWKISESMADKYDDAFRRELFAARVLLIPEMERVPATPKDCIEMRPMLEAFLRAGGNVVVCGAQGSQLDWIRDAGLIELAHAGSVDGAELTFTPKGAAAGKGIQPFQAMNATNAYEIRSPDAVSLAEAGGKPVVVGRRVGRGWVVVIGSDYYMSCEGASKLLGNVIRMR